MNREEALKIVEEKRLLIESLKSEDRFWYFEPTIGEVTPKIREVLSEYLHGEDIPQKVDGQLDVLLNMSSIRGTAGGNQSGKSTVGAIDGYIKSTGEIPLSLEQYKDRFEEIIRRARNKVIRGRVVGVDFKQLNNTVLPTWRDYAPKKYLKNRSWSDSFSSQHNLLTLFKDKKPCASIEFMTNQQDVESFQGPPLDWLKYDEEPREDIHKENLMRFATADTLDIGFYWTPTKGLTWATDLFSLGDIKIGNKKYNIDLFKLCTVSNPKANMDVVREIMNQITDYNELRMRLLGEFISLSGLIYGGLFNRSIHVIPPFPLDYKRHFVVRGLDPHLAKPTYCVEVAVDPEGFEYVVGTYISRRGADTDEIKKDLYLRARERNYRLGWTRCDKSADYEIEIAGINIYQLLKRPPFGIPALEVSDKYMGSIQTGVNEIRRKLKVDEINKPTLFIFDLPENRTLINAFLTLERDTYANEDRKGEKDRILEGKHDAHACLRYINQRVIRWAPLIEKIPIYEPDNVMVAY